MLRPALLALLAAAAPAAVLEWQAFEPSACPTLRVRVDDTAAAYYIAQSQDPAALAGNCEAALPRPVQCSSRATNPGASVDWRVAEVCGAAVGLNYIAPVLGGAVQTCSAADVAQGTVVDNPGATPDLQCSTVGQPPHWTATAADIDIDDPEPPAIDPTVGPLTAFDATRTSTSCAELVSQWTDERSPGANGRDVRFLISGWSGPCAHPDRWRLNYTDGSSGGTFTLALDTDAARLTPPGHTAGWLYRRNHVQLTVPHDWSQFRDAILYCGALAPATCATPILENGIDIGLGPETDWPVVQRTIQSAAGNVLQFGQAHPFSYPNFVRVSGCPGLEGSFGLSTLPGATSITLSTDGQSATGNCAGGTVTLATGYALDCIDEGLTQLCTVQDPTTGTPLTTAGLTYGTYPVTNIADAGSGRWTLTTENPAQPQFDNYVNVTVSAEIAGGRAGQWLTLSGTTGCDGTFRAYSETADTITIEAAPCAPCSGACGQYKLSPVGIFTDTAGNRFSAVWDTVGANQVRITEPTVYDSAYDWSGVFQFGYFDFVNRIASLISLSSLNTNYDQDIHTDRAYFGPGFYHLDPAFRSIYYLSTGYAKDLRLAGVVMTGIGNHGPLDPRNTGNAGAVAMLNKQVYDAHSTGGTGGATLSINLGNTQGYHMEAARLFVPGIQEIAQGFDDLNIQNSDFYLRRNAYSINPDLRLNSQWNFQGRQVAERKEILREVSIGNEYSNLFPVLIENCGHYVLSPRGRYNQGSPLRYIRDILIDRNWFNGPCAAIVIDSGDNRADATKAGLGRIEITGNLMGGTDTFDFAPVGALTGTARGGYFNRNESPGFSFQVTHNTTLLTRGTEPYIFYKRNEQQQYRWTDNFHVASKPFYVGGGWMRCDAMSDQAYLNCGFTAGSLFAGNTLFAGLIDAREPDNAVHAANIASPSERINSAALATELPGLGAPANLYPNEPGALAAAIETQFAEPGSYRRIGDAEGDQTPTHDGHDHDALLAAMGRIDGPVEMIGSAVCYNRAAPEPCYITYGPYTGGDYQTFATQPAPPARLTDSGTAGRRCTTLENLQPGSDYVVEISCHGDDPAVLTIRP